MNKFTKLVKLALVVTGIAACAAQAMAVNISYVDVDGTTKKSDATVVEASDARVTWNAGWYVVTNEVTVKGGADCSGAVNLILADTGKLTINGVANNNAGIKVSGAGNSLAIYGQALGTGALISTGDDGGAGIGGGKSGNGSDITINGGMVTATGGGGGAGIGGGEQHNGGGAGYDITINGGMVTATGGGSFVSGVGAGNDGDARDIFASEDVIVKVGILPNPTDEINHMGEQDIAGDLANKRYVTMAKPNPTITGVKAQQRYPWNGKVDIEYTVSDLTAAAEAKGEMPFLTIMAIDRDATPWTTNVADLACLSIGPAGTEAYTDAVATADGTHQIVWDLDKQKLALVSTNIVFAVLGDGGVQLWENGPYWATCNVGASKPEECGYYFWWGDTVGYKRNASNNGWVSAKDGKSFLFNSENCKTYDKDITALINDKYIDNATSNLVANYDAATAHLGAPWRMPTDAEMIALIDNCNMEEKTQSGVKGLLVKGREAYVSRSIFLPAAGYGYDSDLVVGSNGYYWSSTPYSDYSNYYAWDLFFYSGYFGRYRNLRNYGSSVRPLRGFAK